MTDNKSKSPNKEVLKRAEEQLAAKRAAHENGDTTKPLLKKKVKK